MADAKLCDGELILAVPKSTETVTTEESFQRNVRDLLG